MDTVSTEHAGEIVSSAVEAAFVAVARERFLAADVAFVGLQLVDRFYDQLLCLSAVDGLGLEVFE
jgi:hypothetical protein